MLKKYIQHAQMPHRFHHALFPLMISYGWVQNMYIQNEPSYEDVYS